MKSSPKILAVIPARAGSKGISGKNMKQLGGKPLVQYSIENALMSQYLTSIIISSNCAETLTFATSFPKIRTPFVRPEYLSKDETPTIQVLHHALGYMKSLQETYDWVCLLQPTSPFRNKHLIDNCIEHLISQNADSLFTAKKIPPQFNPHWAFEIREGQVCRTTGEQDIISRRQDLPETWYRDGQVYIASADLIKNMRLYGDHLTIFPNLNSPNINLDTMEDWIKTENIIRDGYFH